MKILTTKSQRTQSWAWMVLLGFVVVGDKESELFDEVWSPRFSPDGLNVVFGARVGRQLWWKVMPIPN
jgi:hypothetical protein